MISPAVELHVHLDGGAAQHSTVYELLKAKNLSVPGDGSYQHFLDVFNPGHPAGVSFLILLGIVLKSVEGDVDAIERISYEFCKSQSEQGIIYTEVRYTPHYFLKRSFSTNGALSPVTTRSIVEAVSRGLERGQQDFNVTVRSLLTCRRGNPDWCQDILELATEFKDRGVVGIDVTGNALDPDVSRFRDESGNFEDTIVSVFQTAAERGIHRTVHAGGYGPPDNVLKALDLLKAERIGHGYRVIEDDKIYKHCLKNKIHFETCPRLGNNSNLAAIQRFANDGASFSINTDTPGISNSTMKDRYDMLTRQGLTTSQFQQSNIDAMKSSFAEPAVKKEILKKLYTAYGIPQYEATKNSGHQSISERIIILALTFALVMRI